MKSLLKSGGHVYSAAIVLPRLPGLLLLPVFATVLSLDDMGRLATSWAFIDCFNIFAGLGLRGALGRYFPLAPTPESRRHTLTAALGGSLGGGLATAAVAWAAYALPPLRERVHFLDAIDTSVFAALLAASVLGNMASTLIVYFRAEQRPWSFFLSSLSGAAVESALFLALIAASRVSVAGILAAEAAKQAVMLAYIAVAGRRDWGLAFSGPTLAAMLRFGAWLVPVGLCEWALNSADRFWLGQMAGLAEVGVYGFLYKFAMPLGILFTGGLMDASSRLYRLQGEDGMGPARGFIGRYLIRGGWLALACAVLLPPVLGAASRRWSVFPEAYLAGLPALPLMAAILYVFYWGKHYAMVLEYGFRTRAIFLGAALPAAASLALVPGGIALCAARGWNPMLGTAAGVLLSHLLATGVMGGMSGMLRDGPRLLPGFLFLAACLAAALPWI